MEMRKENRDKQKGILIVSFGTTYQDTREKNIDEIVKAVREKFPDCEVRQAYSSDKIRKILEKKDGIIIVDSSLIEREVKRNDVFAHISPQRNWHLIMSFRGLQI